MDANSGGKRKGKEGIDLVFRSAIGQKFYTTSTLRFFERTSRQKEGKGGIARTARQTKNEEATRQAWRAEYGNSQLIRGRPPCLKYRQFLRF